MNIPPTTHDKYAGEGEECLCGECIVDRTFRKMKHILEDAMGEAEWAMGGGAEHCRMAILGKLSATIKPSFAASVLIARRVIDMTNYSNVVTEPGEEANVTKFGIVEGEALWLTAYDGTAVYIPSKSLKAYATGIADAAGLDVVERKKEGINEC